MVPSCLAASYVCTPSDRQTLESSYILCRLTLCILAVLHTLNVFQYNTYTSDCALDLLDAPSLLTRTHQMDKKALFQGCIAAVLPRP